MGVAVGKSPIVYRYIDWSLTVPLQMIEFDLILKAAKAPIGPAAFWSLLVGTVAILAFGYAGGRPCEGFRNFYDKVCEKAQQLEAEKPQAADIEAKLHNL